jgi:hypothetical protein
MVPLTQPLNAEQVEHRMDRNGYIKVVLQISLSDLIKHDIEGLNSLVADRILREGLLSDITYDVSGYTFNGSSEDGEYLPKDLLIEVTGQVVDCDSLYDCI